MTEITETICKVQFALDEEYAKFRNRIVKCFPEDIFRKAHVIDVKRYMYEFLTDEPEEYLTEKHFETLLEKAGSILRELYHFMKNSEYAYPYFTDEQCSKIVIDYVENLCQGDLNEN